MATDNTSLITGPGKLISCRGKGRRDKEIRGKISNLYAAGHGDGWLGRGRGAEVRAWRTNGRTSAQLTLKEMVKDGRQTVVL